MYAKLSRSAAIRGQLDKVTPHRGESHGNEIALLKHAHTPLPNQTVTLGWQSPGAATKDHDTQRHFVTYCADAVCCCQPASQPASPQMPLT